MKTSAKPLVIRDEVHGDMVFDGLVRLVVDHPYFQRLRTIRQIGLAEYVYPCATHTRFQHSLGAAYLAGRYFDSLVEAWSEQPIQIAEPQRLKTGTTHFHTERTAEICGQVRRHGPSLAFWRQCTVLAGLLHDVGHGPLSHTFELLNLEHDFSGSIEKTTGNLREFLRDKFKSGRLMHEEISLLYIGLIFQDLEKHGVLSQTEAWRLTLGVGGLVRNALALGAYAKGFATELSEALAVEDICGGEEFHRLLRPLISGTFDVDRLDYIQRDGRNCGVPAGAIEWRRIVTKVLPCLAEHENDSGEPNGVVLLSNMRNQHVLDDFVFSLFQMYTQVYLHPKIVSMEEEIKHLLRDKLNAAKPFRLDLETHAELSDERFLNLLQKDFDIAEIGKVLRREPGYRFEVASFPTHSGLAEEYRSRGFVPLQGSDRPMLKDALGVFLYHQATDAGAVETTLVRSWYQISPVAGQFRTISYAPEVWVRRIESLQ